MGRDEFPLGLSKLSSFNFEPRYVLYVALVWRDLHIASILKIFLPFAIVYSRKAKGTTGCMHSCHTKPYYIVIGHRELENN
jgi:hypothetical protein